LPRSPDIRDSSLRSLRSLLERRGEENPEGAFCHFQDDVITFGALDLAVNRLANGLASTGVGRGTRVPVMLPNHPDHIFTMLALAKLGATHVPVNVHLKSAGLTFLLSDCAAEHLVADIQYREELEPALRACTTLRSVVWRGDGGPPLGQRMYAFHELAAGSAVVPGPSGCGPDDVVAVLYTSGTTGPPKGVLVTERMYQAAGRTAALVADVQPGDVLFLWEPLYHIAGVQAIVLCLQRGVSCALVERFSASRFWQQVRRYRATQIHYLGGVVSLLMKQQERPDDADNPVRIAWGAATPVDMWRSFEERFGVRVHECYGLTEGSSFTTINRDGKLGSIGKPVDHFEVCIIDDEGRTLGPDERGEIVQRGREPGLLMKGYLNNAEATRAALRDGWLHTGDVGYHDADGFFYFVGRKKDSIRSRGENVSAWEVERALIACPGVEECAVIGVPSGTGEEEIKVLIRGGNPRPDPLDVIRCCEKQLAYFQVPRYIEFVAEFPKTPSERIRKELLSRSTEGCWDREQSGYQLQRAAR
jgi:crotonobetaine/carnitine-CoA ligase